jgi:hypothetical protein
VNLINWQGLAIFGPGSEWFWSMAQFIVVVVTLFGIYRQLHAQASSNALGRLEALSRRWESRLLTLARVRSAVSLRYGERQPGMSKEMHGIANFFVDLANLHEEGHISIREIENNWGTNIQVWVALLHDSIQEAREIEGDPLFLNGLDDLAAQLHARRLARGGQALQIDAASTPGWLDRAIAVNIAALELMHDAESDFIPRPPMPATPEVESPTLAT